MFYAVDSILGLDKTIFIALVCGLAAAIILVLLIYIFWRQKRKKDIKKGKVKIIDGVRYSLDDRTVQEDGTINVTHQAGDLVLKQNKTYKADRNGYLRPGKYIVLSAGGEDGSFNIRLGGFVREYSHNSNIVIAEGEEITSVSHSVVLR